MSAYFVYIYKIFELIFFLIVILGFVFWLLFKSLVDFNSYTNKKTIREINYGSIIEVVWTIVPALILVLVAIPSFTLLYSLDEIVDPALSIKVIGHQWY
jgi:cytochrome c oxidase subunit 2